MITPDALAHADRNFRDALSDLQHAVAHTDTVATLEPVWRLGMTWERQLLELNTAIGKTLVKREVTETRRG